MNATASTAELLTRRLELAYDWYCGMVNEATGRLEYIYLPESDAFLRERSPIRDIASVWDLELLSAVVDRHELDVVIRTSLAHYTRFLVDHGGDLVLDPVALGEPSSIAHSAFLLLALLHAQPSRDVQQIARLANGILHQQRSDGSYVVHFTDLPDMGEELYAGEAMLALSEAYRALKDAALLASVERGLDYYDARYFGGGRVSEDLLVFFANWQSQACRVLYECTSSTAVKHHVTAYVARMHDRIISSGFYDHIEHRPKSQAGVEVACAVEGLADACVVVRAEGGDVERYRQPICTGLDYLTSLQCTGKGTRERGGFGMALDDRLQRVDVTGHAASAFMKCIAAAIDCPDAARRNAE